MAVLAFSILCATVLAQPAITQIEEMGRLVHRKILKILSKRDQRRESGDSIKRTGTDIRLPSRQICT